jgi:threonine dehydratase
MVAPYDDAATITGQGTVGLEIVEQLAALDGRSDGRISGRREAASSRLPAALGGRRAAASSSRPTELTPFTVLVPVGGGGIASGVAVAVKSLRPDAVVIGVEPDLAADARDSLAQGQIVTWPADTVGRTIADGQRTTHIGRIPFALMRLYLDAIVTVTEDEIARAMVRASREARLVLEPSGATALAAWLFHEAELPETGRVVSILTGGNVDPARYDELLARGIAAGG